VTRPSGAKHCRQSLELPDEAAARALAQELANKSGREIVVTNEAGDEVCATRPQRNQV
jgi:hypothetical protein